MKRIPLLFGLICWSILTFADPTTITEFIRIDQLGYRPGDQKVAVIANPINGFNSGQSFIPGNSYEVRRWNDDTTVFTGSIQAFNNGNTHLQSGDQVWWFDFSALTIPGNYYIYDVTNGVGSYQFTISDEVYQEALKQAMRVFYHQRCGVAKTSIFADVWGDDSCHTHSGQDLACRLVTDQGNASTAKDLSGGWHDAGDYNKYTNFTYSPVHALLFAYQKNPSVFGDNYNIPESGNGIPDILDEVKFELEWLLKMQKTDGSLLMKMGVTAFQSASPASADLAARYYGEAAASSTAVGASLFAHAYLIFKDLPGMNTFSNTLLARAEAAWEWIENNPGFSSYANSGFSSANPELSTEQQKEVRIGAAIMLFASTGNTIYRDYVDANYTDIRPIQWTYWYPFQPTIQEIALFYHETDGATSSIANAINNSFTNSTIGNNVEMLPAWLNETDAYRAYLKDNNYVWGSNQVHARTGTMFVNMNYYSFSPENALDFKNAALGYLHYLHGVNPLGKMMLTNMSNFGGENSCNEMYHGWFGDGTDYDNAQTSLYGPPPGFVTGGANPNFSPANGYISPPQDQPIQKSYKDWNTSWPENSWEITEPAIYYQAAYIQLLSAYAGPGDAVLPITLQDFYLNPEGETVKLVWITSHMEGISHLEIERKNKDGFFGSIGSTSDVYIGKNVFVDREPHQGLNYYRLKIVNYDGGVTYSKTLSCEIKNVFQVDIHPNPAGKRIDVKVKTDQTIKAYQLTLISETGHLALKRTFYRPANDFEVTIELEKLARGIYFLELNNGFYTVVKKVILE